MTAQCYFKMFAKRIIPDHLKVTPHRLHISLYIRLSKCSPILSTAAFLYAAFLAFDVGERQHSSSKSLTLIYLGCFTTHFGTQIWMTLISGIVLFLNVPRKVFGLVQRHLFPKYFLLNSTLAFLTLWIFVLQHPDLIAQRWNLAVCFFCNMMGLWYIVPDMINTMAERAELEHEHGVGEDVIGRFKATGELASNPKYCILMARFRTFHSLCAIVNLVAMGCNAGHLWHLADKIVNNR